MKEYLFNLTYYDKNNVKFKNEIKNFKLMNYIAIICARSGLWVLKIKTF